MNQHPIFLHRSARRVAPVLGAAALFAMAGMASAQTAKPVKIGVVAPASAIDGKSIFQGAELAAKQINTNGGIDGRKVQIVKLDDHASASNAVRAFQRAVRQDHVVAVTGAFISEVALSLESWAARLKTPFIVTGAASTKITQRVHDHYSQYKYIFHDTINSYQLGQAVCDFASDKLVNQLHLKTAAVMVENAAWTKPLNTAYQKCLPKAGLKVVNTDVFSPNTSDFTPIFNKIEQHNPDVIIAGMAHVGVKPTVQWHNQRVPSLLAGENAQAGSTNFWKDTNGATQGVITWQAGVHGAAVTDNSIPFQNAYRKQFGTAPAYDAYSTYDSLFMLKNAIEKHHSKKAEKIVSALEKTDYNGTWGRIRFQGKNGHFAHGLVYGKNGFRGVMLQWQQAKQVAIWPNNAANGSIMVPDFVKNKN